MTQPIAASQATITTELPYAASQAISGLSQAQFAQYVLDRPETWVMKDCPAPRRLAQIASGLSREQYALREKQHPTILLVPRSPATSNSGMPPVAAQAAPAFPQVQEKKSVPTPPVRSAPNQPRNPAVAFVTEPRVAGTVVAAEAPTQHSTPKHEQRRKPLLEESAPAQQQTTPVADPPAETVAAAPPQLTQSQAQILDSNVRTPDDVHVLPPPTFSYMMVVVRLFDFKALALVLAVLWLLIYRVFSVMPHLNPWYETSYVVVPTVDGLYPLLGVSLAWHFTQTSVERFVAWYWGLQAYSLTTKWITHPRLLRTPLRLINTPWVHWFTLALATPALWNLLHYYEIVETEWLWEQNNHPIITRLFLRLQLAELKPVPGIETAFATFAANYICGSIMMIISSFYSFYRTFLHFKKFFVPTEILIPDFKADIETMSLEHSVDSELLAYVVRAAQFTGRTRDTVDQLKRAAVSWIASNRKSWKEADITHAVSKCIMLAMSYTGLERAVSELWATDPIYQGLRAASSTSKGNLAGGRMLATA